MTKRVRNQPDFLSGILFIVVGLAFAVGSRAYDLGTTSQMGPGYFPLALGVLLAAIGSVVAFQSMAPDSDTEKVEPLFFKPMLLVLGPVALFGVMLFPLGFVISAVVMILLTARATPEFRLRYVIPMMIVLIIGCYLVFVYGLGLPMPVWPQGW